MQLLCVISVPVLGGFRQRPQIQTQISLVQAVR